MTIELEITTPLFTNLKTVEVNVSTDSDGEVDWLEIKVYLNNDALKLRDLN